MESGWERHFPHLSGPELGHTQPRIQEIPVHFRSKAGRSAVQQKLKKEKSYTSTASTCLHGMLQGEFYLTINFSVSLWLAKK